MKNKYPLEQLVHIKQRRLDEAERVLKEKKEKLNKQKEHQKQLEDSRDETFKHHNDKIQQLRDELDQGTTTDKIESMRDYIKVVDTELKQKEKKVEDQIKIVKKAEEEVEIARKDLVKKQHDIEKLKTHRKEWEKEMKITLAYEEGLESDEIGTIIHTSKKHKK